MEQAAVERADRGPVERLGTGVERRPPVDRREVAEADQPGQLRPSPGRGRRPAARSPPRSPGRSRPRRRSRSRPAGAARRRGRCAAGAPRRGARTAARYLPVATAHGRRARTPRTWDGSRRDRRTLAAMTTLHIEVQINDLDAWRAGYAEHAENRRRAGVRHEVSAARGRRRAAARHRPRLRHAR